MSVLYVLAAVVLLGVIVAVHEFGHYCMGRLTGMAILEYAIGFGPKIVSFTKNGIRYSLRLIPLGGYCAFLGEDADVADDPRAMRKQPVWKRFLTVLSGPLFNFILAFLATILLIWGFGMYENTPVVHALVEGSAAEQAGLAPGDSVTSINGLAISQDAKGQALLIDTIRSLAGEEEVPLTVLRGEETLSLSVTPQWNAEENVWQIGVLLGTVHVRYSFLTSVRLSGGVLMGLLAAMIESLKLLFTTKEAFEQTMGPVGIISTVSSQVSQGFDYVLNWVIIISANLGIMNLLPIPGLDGGRLLFLLVEGVRRKPIPAEKEAWVHAIGVILVLGLVVVITFKDILRLFTGG